MEQQPNQREKREKVEPSLIAAFDYALSEEDPGMIGELYTYAASECNLPTDIINEIYDEALQGE